MKVKNDLVIMALTGCLAIMLFWPVITLATSCGPNPNLPGADEKLSGPRLDGTLIAGYKPYGTDTIDGTVEVFLHIENHLYRIIYEGRLEADFLAIQPIHLPYFTLPPQIIIDYDKHEANRAIICEEKDVSNFDKELGITDPYAAYKHLLHCDVKIWFVVPK